MPRWLSDLSSGLSADLGAGIPWGSVFGTAVLVLLGLVAHRGVSTAFDRAGGGLSRQHQMIARRAALGALWALIGTSVLRTWGLDLSVLVGAAGLVTVAVGFASQTSASNLISGLFLVAERPFVVGDTILVGGTTGVAESIDLLSVKMRTFDNLMVRVPNETLLKSELTNITHYPIRRVDVVVLVPFDADQDLVMKLLTRVADAEPLCMDEPEPSVLFLDYSEVGVRVRLAVWVERTQFVAMKNLLPGRIKVAFDAEGIRQPLPQRVVTMVPPGSQTPDAHEGM